MVTERTVGVSIGPSRVSTFFRSNRGNWTEHIVIAGGGLVAEDDRECVEEKRAEVKDAATNSLASAATGARSAAISLVACDHTGQNRDGCAGVNEEAASETVAPIAAAGPCSAQDLVVHESAVTESHCYWPGEGVDKEAIPNGAAFGIAAVAPRGARAASAPLSLVACEIAVV